MSQTNPLERGMGSAVDPAGRRIGIASHGLLLDGRPWMPVMGEMQYSRVPRAAWRDGLLKMQAGGIGIVATYVFWIHHEEEEGRFDFAGGKSLRDFVALCGELGLYLQLRCGPWAHGECRNGGFPDWLLRKGHFAVVPEESKGRAGAVPEAGRGYPLRTDDPGYLAEVARLYHRVADEVRGLLWKDGGPVIGTQIENEYDGPAEHLLTLKRIARDAGIDVPLYTYTGWPKAWTPMPFGEMLPLYGGYAEGFWDRTAEAMPGDYWKGFAFQPQRIDSAIATDHFGVGERKDAADAARYPYLTCEIGGGMPSSYHRRVRLFPKDVAVPALVKLGVGASLPGFYMFHGGTHPEGRFSTLQESQASGYPNDLPVKSYDFQAPLGEFGQVRGHFHLLRRMNLFIQDYGARLARMESRFPAPMPGGRDDTATLRWCVRGDGDSAFVFVNNYQRLQPMPAKPGVRFPVRLQGGKGEVTVPARPITVPADSCFVWPVRLDLGGAVLAYATAELLCNLEQDDARYFFFVQTAGVEAEFVFDEGIEVQTRGALRREAGRLHVTVAEAGLDAALSLRSADGRDLRIVLLDQETSLACWKTTVAGRPRLVLTTATPLPDGDGLRCLRVDGGAAATVALLPSPARIEVDGAPVAGAADGVFLRYALPAVPAPPVAATAEAIRRADPARVVPTGPFGVAEAPGDAEFDRAAAWRIRLSGEVPPGLIVRFDYMGDVARLYLDGRLVADNFYNGTAFDFGLDAHFPGVLTGELILKILPLRKDAPIYLLPEAWPKNPTDEGTAELKSVIAIATIEQRMVFKD